jgi:hypothetical protein
MGQLICVVPSIWCWQGKVCHTTFKQHLLQMQWQVSGHKANICIAASHFISQGQAAHEMAGANLLIGISSENNAQWVHGGQ